MSYGWMLLVVALVGGAVFSLVQDQGIESVSGFTGKEVTIDDFGLNSDDKLMLSMRNTAADRVRIKAVELEDPETGATTRVLSEKNIEVGDTRTVKVDGFERTSSSNKQDLKIIYGSGGIDDQMVEGTITGKLKAKNHVYLQNAAFNRSTNTLNITAQNTGNTEATVDYAVNSDSNSFNGNLGTVSSGETTSFAINTDETFPLQNVSLDVEGQYFSNSQKQLKCTPTNGLVGYWPFNKEQTQNGWAVDLSQQQNNGSVDARIELNKGKVGESYGFDGSDLVVALGEIPHAAKSYTFSAWVRPKNSADDGSPHVIHTDFGRNDLRLEIRNGLFTYYQDDEDGNRKKVVHPADFGNWQHVVARWNGSKINLFLDTDSVDSNSISAMNDNDRVAASIGNHYYRNDAWEGKLDEPRIYNRSLSQKEIQRLYNVRSEDWAVEACKLTN